MKDRKGKNRMQCLKASCDCDEYTKEKDFDLCVYCDHAPVLHKLEDSFNLIEDVHSVDFTKSNPMQNTLSKPAFLNESEKGFNVCSNDFMSPLKKHCMFPDTVLTNKVISTSKTIVHNKSCALFENGLAPILKSCTDGMIVLSATNLTFSLRNKLAGVVVNHVIQKRGLQNRPTNADIFESANAIVAHFPSEKLETWYTAPTFKKSIAGGKLTEKLRNTWRNIKSVGILKSSNDQQLVEEHDSSDEEAVQDDLNWLKFNSQPWTEVCHKWKLTSKFRLKSFQSGSKDIPNFKLLLDLKADALVNINFTQLSIQKNYVDCNNFMFQKIPLLAKQLLGLVAKKHLIKIEVEDETAALLAIVRLTCCKRSIRLSKDAKRKSWTPSVKECGESFLFLANSVEDAEHSIENIRILYNDLKLTLQPLVYAVPPNIAVAVYNNHRWSFQTPLKAMDFSFKLIQVLNKEYNIASFPAWMFLQKYIYCFNCPDFDVSCPKASELASELNL
nr:uncharacterized protein LOC124819367 isoform X3 [Hydra vulgaris]